MPQSAAGDKWVLIQIKPPGHIFGFGDADARTGDDEPSIGWGCGCPQRDRAAEYCACVAEADAERLREAAGSGGEQARVGELAAANHFGQTGRWLKGPDEYGLPLAGPARYDVEAGMNAIATVGVHTSPCAEHWLCPAGWTAKGVAGRVVWSEIRFYLNDPAGGLDTSDARDEVPT